MAYYIISTSNLMSLFSREQDDQMMAFYKHLWRYGTQTAISKNKTQWAIAVLRHIEIPINKMWGGNYAVVLSALFATQGPILELGICPIISPLIHNVAAEFSRPVLTVDSDPELLARFLVLQNAGHQFGFVSDLPFPKVGYVQSPVKQMARWSDVGTDSDWGLVVVSCSPQYFGIDDIWSLRERTSAFVIADPLEHLFDHQRRDMLHHKFPYGFFFRDPQLGLHETVVWSLESTHVVHKIRKLSCWTGEILAERKPFWNQTDCH